MSRLWIYGVLALLVGLLSIGICYAKQPFIDFGPMSTAHTPIPTGGLEVVFGYEDEGKGQAVVFGTDILVFGS